MNTIVFEDAQALVHGAADHLAALITAAPSPRVSVGLAGGSTPAAIYVQLRERDVDWSRVDFWLSDERWVPWHDQDSNGKMAEENLVGHVSGRYLRPRWAPWLEPGQSAAQYEEELRSLHPSEHPPDLILLGMGDDGHCASLFPGTEALSVIDRWFVANFVPSLDVWRLTSTFSLLDRARQIIFMIGGASKAEALARVAGGEDLPTTRVSKGSAPVTFLLDQPAAALIA
ncbi:MAG TPA: 6-phosphogluconolactonase [Acidimicrobiia bacterium]|nr:6-phosphogluconolactonase [Acidimicrobiia bacterium]